MTQRFNVIVAKAAISDWAKILSRKLGDFASKNIETRQNPLI